MPLNLKLKKAVEKSVLKPLPPKPVYEGGALIDRVGELTPEAKKIADKIAVLQKQLLPYATALQEMEAFIQADDSLDPDTTHVLRGEKFQVEVGKKGKSREIVSMEAVREALTDDTFMKVAKVTLSDMDTYLTGNQVAALVEVKRTKRTVKEVQERPD